MQKSGPADEVGWHAECHYLAAAFFGLAVAVL